MNRMFLGAAVAIMTVSPALKAGVFYSPVFNMPLQPAPSPSNGGFYWVLPDGRLWGPNYYLVPPFTPISGFNSAYAGQQVFSEVFNKYLKTGPAKGHGHHAKEQAPQGPPKSVGIVPYTQDYSDPRTVSAGFDQQNGPGYPPVPAQPAPRAASYPNYPSQPNYSRYAASGYGAPYYGYHQYIAAQMPAYQTYYQPMSAGPVMRAQAQMEIGPPPTPQGQGGAPGSVPIYLPSLPANGYAPNLPAFSNQNPPLPCPPGVPSTFPWLPSPSYVPPNPPNPQFPQLPTQLPTPHYAPEPCFDGCGQPGYLHPSAVRSPRDFFMWGDVKEDERQRERKALMIP